MAQYGEQIGGQWHVRKMQPVVWNDDGVFISLETLESWTPEQCAEFGVPRIPESSTVGIEDGQIEVSRTLVDIDGSPAWVVVYGLPPAPPALPVPVSVTNFQARAAMRQHAMPDGRSLFTTVDTDFREAVAATREMDEFHPDRMAADVNWQAWEQANSYERNGTLVSTLAARYELAEAVVDDLFRKAELVTA